MAEDSRPCILDLFCGAGGAAMGYHRAGFDVVGVDIEPQPHYPFEFHRQDALEALRNTRDWRAAGFDAIHASPPCQAYSAGARMRLGKAKKHPRLIEPVRDLLDATGLPWVIENVPEAPLRRDVVLCGSMFGLAVRRHRVFEMNRLIWGPPPCRHREQPLVVGVYGDHPEDSVIRKGHPAIRARDLAHAHEAMGMDWADWHGTKEAIPPAYTEFIGTQLLAHTKASAGCLAPLNPKRPAP